MYKIKCIVAVFSLIFASILVSGCATHLSSKGASVRITSHFEEVKGCKYLGQVVSSSHWGGSLATGVAFDSAMNQLKNKAAAMGANVLLTQSLSNTMGGTRMIGDAYSCQSRSGQ